MGGPRITDAQKEEMSQLYSEGKSLKEISNLLGVSQYAIRTYVEDIERGEGKPALEDGELLSDISGYDGMYKVSSRGRVFTFRANNGPRTLKMYLSKKSGYIVLLGDSGQMKRLRVDHLVANAFCERASENETEVKHIDGNILNNEATNLCWVAPEKPCASGKRKRTRVLSDVDVADVRSRWVSGERVASIASDYGVSTSTIDKEVKGLLRDIPEPPCEPGEEWKPVYNYEGAYCVSSHGRMFSTGRGRRIARLMAPSYNYAGYAHVSLTDDDGHTSSHAVHRLVAAAFCDGYDDEHNVVNHIDGDPTNNYADNLEWCTPQENTQHAKDELGVEMGGARPFYMRTQRVVAQQASAVKRSSLRRFTDEEVALIRSDQRSARQIAKAYGVNKCTIVNIRRGITYRELP